MTYQISEVDEQRFGIRVARADCADLVSLNHALLQAHADSISLLVARIPVSPMDLVQAAIARGGLVSDVLTISECRVGDCPGGNFAKFHKNDFSIRLIRENEGDVLIDLVGRLFDAYENHYASDRNLDSERVRLIYPDWARQLHLQEDARIIVLAKGGDLYGLSAVKELNPDSWDIALFGISVDVAGLGWGAELLSATKAMAREHAVHTLSYSTQLGNLAARRMVARAGFIPARDVFTLHFWL